MPNYFGKQRLVRILYNYLEWTAPEKLAELKRELKEAGEYRKYEIKYTKRRGSQPSSFRKPSDPASQSAP